MSATELKAASKKASRGSRGPLPPMRSFIIQDLEFDLDKGRVTGVDTRSGEKMTFFLRDVETKNSRYPRPDFEELAKKKPSSLLLESTFERNGEWSARWATVVNGKKMDYPRKEVRGAFKKIGYSITNKEGEREKRVHIYAMPDESFERGKSFTSLSELRKALTSALRPKKAEAHPDNAAVVIARDADGNPLATVEGHNSFLRDEERYMSGEEAAEKFFDLHNQPTPEGGPGFLDQLATGLESGEYTASVHRAFRLRFGPESGALARNQSEFLTAPDEDGERFSGWMRAIALKCNYKTEDENGDETFEGGPFVDKLVKEYTGNVVATDYPTLEPVQADTAPSQKSAETTTQAETSSETQAEASEPAIEDEFAGMEDFDLGDGDKQSAPAAS